MRNVCALVLALVLALPAAAAAQASVVAQKKAELGLSTNLSREQLHALAKAVASAAGGQLLVPTGDACQGFSCDKICLGGRVIDYLGDSEGSATPAWSDIGPVSPPLTCAAVPGGGTTPPPPPPPDDVLNLLKDIQSLLGTVHGESWAAAEGVGQLRAEVDAARKELEALTIRLNVLVPLLTKDREIEFTLFGQRVKGVVKGPK